MPKTNPPKTILLVSNNQELIETTRTNLASNDFNDVIARMGNREELAEIIAETQPKLILLDFDFDPEPIKFIQEAINAYPHIAFVPILTEAHMANADQIMLTEARVFVKYPYQQNALILTVKRAIAYKQSEQKNLEPGLAQEAPTKHGHVITVFSPKGGAGTTTFAVNLAISLHKQVKEDVLLIDGKLLFGHVPLHLNLRTGNSLTDLIPHLGMLDQRLIRQVVVQHVSGIYVLPSPLSIFDGQGIRPEDLYTLLQALQLEFPHIIIDAGSHLNENSVTFMDASNKIMLVANPNIAALRDARQFMEVATSLSYPVDKIMLILYGAGKRLDIKQEEIENILKMKVFGIIPADGDEMRRSLNEGVPIVIMKPTCAISRAFKGVSKSLIKTLESIDTQQGEKPNGGLNKRAKRFFL
jgi:pilus assembly protein CpaE